MSHLLQGGGEGDGSGSLAVRSDDLRDVGNFDLRMAHRIEEGFDPFEAEGDVPAPVQLGTHLRITSQRRNMPSYR
jgi:hypothetical protein